MNFSEVVCEFPGSIGLCLKLNKNFWPVFLRILSQSLSLLPFPGPSNVTIGSFAIISWVSMSLVFVFNLF